MHRGPLCSTSAATCGAAYEMFFLNRQGQEFSRDAAGRVPNENLGRRNITVYVEPGSRYDGLSGAIRLLVDRL
jgi:hypothetical protein